VKKRESGMFDTVVDGAESSHPGNTSMLTYRKHGESDTESVQSQTANMSGLFDELIL